MKTADIRYTTGLDTAIVYANSREIGETKMVRMTSHGYQYDGLQYRDVTVLDCNETPAKGNGRSHWGWVPVPAGLGFTSIERRDSLSKSDYTELVQAFGAFKNKGDAVRVVAHESGFKALPRR